MNRTRPSGLNGAFCTFVLLLTAIALQFAASAAIGRWAEVSHLLSGDALLVATVALVLFALTLRSLLLVDGSTRDRSRESV